MSVKAYAGDSSRWLSEGKNREEWERLSGAVELGEGFQLFALRTPDELSEKILAEQLAEFCQEIHWHLVEVDLSTLRAKTAVAEVQEMIDRARHPCVFFLRSGELLGKSKELGELFLYFNQKRDVLAAHVDAPFLLSLHPDDWEEFQNQAPDFWSIHQSVYRFSGLDFTDGHDLSFVAHAGPLDSSSMELGAKSVGESYSLRAERLWTGTRKSASETSHRGITRGAEKESQRVFRGAQPSAPQFQDFIGRVSGLGALESMLLTEQPRVAIVGAVGIGKTALLRVVLKRLASRYSADQVIYLPISELGNTLPLQIRRAREEVVARLLPTARWPLDDLTLEALYRRATAKSQALVVCEDVEEGRFVEALRPESACGFLVTGPESLATPSDFRRLNLHGLPWHDSLDFVRSLAPHRSEEMVKRVARASLGHPLLLQLAGRFLAVEPEAVEHWLSDEKRLGAGKDESTLAEESSERLSLLLQILEPPLRESMERLAVLESEFDEAAAVAVMARGEEDGRRTLQELERRGWLPPEEWLGGRRLHPLLREVALQELADSGEETAVRHTHAEYFFSLVANRSEDPAEFFQAWREDLTAAAGWALEASERGEPVQDLLLLGGVEMSDFLLPLSVEEGVQWAETVATAASRVGRKDVALRAVQRAAKEALMDGMTERAEALFHQQITLAQEFREGRSQVKAWEGLSRAYSDLGRRQDARRCANQAVEAIEGLGLPAEESDLFLWMSFLAAQEADREGERRSLERAVALARSAGDPQRELRVEISLGFHLVQAGEAEAEDHLERVRELLAGVSDTAVTANGFRLLGLGYASLGKGREARKPLTVALELLQQLGDLRTEAGVWVLLGEVEARHGDERSARNRYQEALALYEQLHEQAGIEQVTELLKALEG